MPGTNLTRAEAQSRSAIIATESYDVVLDLTTGPDRFASTTTVVFTSSQPGAETFVDLIDAEDLTVTLNGTALDASAAYADSRIALGGLAAENTLVVTATLPYSHTGEGLHRFVDPADDRVYTYTQFETADSRRVFAVFEQPDLKAVFTFHVTAPTGWAVVNNTPVASTEPASEGATLTHFETTRRMASYITAIIAGEYHGVQREYVGEFQTIPLGFWARQSLVPHLDVDKLQETTEAGFRHFEKSFGVPYPFGKYDQLFVPEYNMGAMENAGAVTFRDEYLPRSRQASSFFEFRSNVIMHEMAHMWFGDLVTMKWWDDLWLNESFAEWSGTWANAEVTEFHDAWTGFANARKVTGYTQDQMPTTHPIAADNYDLQAVEVNFDMITYAKGASVLKQLVAWVGIDSFLKGVKAYFEEFAYKNSEFTDLLGHLEKASGRELSGWADEWLKTAGVNTLTPAFEVDADGSYTSFSVQQTANPDWPTLRRHRLGLGLYDLNASGSLVRRQYLEVDIAGASSDIAELVGVRQPDLLLLNDNDLAYAKIRLDERSLATALTSLGRIEDSLARALIWSATWDMTRDAELAATAWVELVLANIGTETDGWGLTRIPANTLLAVNQYTAPAHRAAVRDRWESGLLGLAKTAEAGSDHQLTFLRQLTAVAHSPAVIDWLKGLLAGTTSLAGLEIDQDLRWTILAGLAAAGAVGETEISAELTQDSTISGKEKAAAARASLPDAAAKAAAWEAAIVSTDTPNETARQTAGYFLQAGQDALLAPYVDKYFEAAETVWEHLGSHRASVALASLFPRLSASPELLAKADAWLASTKAEEAVKRYVSEGRAGVVRSLAAQAKDAEQ